MKLLLLHGHDAIPGDLLHVADAVRAALPSVSVILPVGPVRLPSGRWAWWNDDDGPSAAVVHLGRYLDDGPLVVAGFSQGGAVALAVAGRPEVHGVASVGGFFHDPTTITESSAPLFVAHGRNDEVVDVFHAESLTRRAARLDVEHELVLHDGAHEWPLTVTERFVSWLAGPATYRGPENSRV